MLQPQQRYCFHCGSTLEENKGEFQCSATGLGISKNLYSRLDQAAGASSTEIEKRSTPKMIAKKKSCYRCFRCSDFMEEMEKETANSAIPHYKCRACDFLYDPMTIYLIVEIHGGHW